MYLELKKGGCNIIDYVILVANTQLSRKRAQCSLAPINITNMSMIGRCQVPISHCRQTLSTTEVSNPEIPTVDPVLLVIYDLINTRSLPHKNTLSFYGATVIVHYC